MRRRSQNRSYAICALESRQLLSGGNVQASVVGGTLTITGDNVANELMIEQSSEGLRIQTTGGTRLNGATNGTLTFTNPTQTNIDLKGGNDRLTLGDFLGAGVSVQMGSGNDQVNLNGISTDGDLVIDLGAGNDGLLSKRGGPGLSDPNVVGGNLRLVGGAGRDRLFLTNLNALHDLTVDAGTDNDVVLLSTNSTNGITSVLLGSGNDIMSVSTTTSRGLFSFNAGTGDDLMSLQLCEFEQPATFDMGVGKDALLSRENLYLANVTQAGGTGSDTLFSSLESFSADHTVTSFEILPTSTAQVQSLLAMLATTFE